MTDMGSGKRAGRVLLFAGTTEGRELAAYLGRQSIDTLVSVATDYGKEIIFKERTGLPDSQLNGYLTVRSGRLDAEGIKDLILRENISLTVDASHPYARELSLNIEAACESTGCILMRLNRESSNSPRDCVIFSSDSEAAAFLNQKSGNVLLATGSNNLNAYTAIAGYQERLFVRILSVEDSIKKALDLGFRGKNLICMQGPFSREMNLALLRQVNASYMVTKESGHAGGFEEKISACREAEARLILIRRPDEPSAAHLNDSSKNASDIFEMRSFLIKELDIDVSRDICLSGTGMGSLDTMTLGLCKAVEKAELIIGAARMLDAVKALPGTDDKSFFCEYRPEPIISYLRTHPQYERILILFSGDPAFYSGAGKLYKRLKEENFKGTVSILPGISSMSALCAALPSGWEDALPVSLHGRDQNLTGAVRSHEKVFALVQDEAQLEKICKDLIRFGLSHVRLHAGRSLSYPDESIETGSPGQILASLSMREGGRDSAGLICLMIENTSPDDRIYAGFADDSFIRNVRKKDALTVPMTKSEVRALILSKLQLKKKSIVYDVGAGTGSVSVECAVRASDGHVYAIERREDAAVLIEQNAERFSASNLTVVRGWAPEALEELPSADRAFIGGSGGRLKQIVKALLMKNPGIRLVISAVCLETLSGALSCIKELSFSEPEIVQISVSRAKLTSSGHMMTGSNPVYLITATGNGIEQEQERDL